MDSLWINESDLMEREKVFIIAEMSANHLQDLNRAKKIILAAKSAGADAVKIQTYRPDTITIDCYGEDFLCTPGSPWDGRNMYELYQETFTPWEWHEELFRYAQTVDILMFSSPFDLTAVDFLRQFNMPAYKIASYEITDIPLIKRVAAEMKPVIISTGLATLQDVELAVNTCKSTGNDKVILLKCVSEYPTPYEDINLKTMVNLKETFGCAVGVSDHSIGSCIPIAAVALGARVVEKHFTLSRADGGADSEFSMEPDEFKTMVHDIRNLEKALGKVSYVLTDRQKESRKRSRSLYAVKDIRKGETLTEENVKSIRPGAGLHPKYYEEILGKKVSEDIKKGTPIKWKNINL